MILRCGKRIGIDNQMIDFNKGNELIFWRIFWREFFRHHSQKKSAGPGPPIGPTMPWPVNFSDTLTPHLRTPTRI